MRMGWGCIASRVEAHQEMKATKVRGPRSAAGNDVSSDVVSPFLRRSISVTPLEPIRERN